MSLPLIVRPAAETDIQQAYDWLEEAQAGLGDRFAERLQEAFHRIEAMPELYGFVWQDIRAVRLRRFRYVMYYVAFSDRIEVLAVVHGFRHESAWKSRI